MEVLTALRSARRYELGKDELAGDVTSPRQWGDAETRARAWEFVKQVLANVRWRRAALELFAESGVQSLDFGGPRFRPRSRKELHAHASCCCFDPPEALPARTSRGSAFSSKRGQPGRMRGPAPT